MSSRRDFINQMLSSSAALYGWRLFTLLPGNVIAKENKLGGSLEMVFVETAGTPHEIGRQYAEKAGDLFRNFVKVTVDKLYKRFEPEPMKKGLETMLSVLEHDFPYLVDEMRGMAEGIKIDFNEVAVSQLSGGFGAFIDESEGCSNIIFTESDRGPILGKTFDGSSQKSETGIVRLIKPKNGRAILCETRIGGISTESGINEDGLAVGESSLHFYTVNPRGIIRNILPRLILQECMNVEEAVQFIARYPVLRFGFHFALVDKSGSAVIVERSPIEMYMRRAEGKTIFCTNHTATPCMRKIEKSRGPVGDKNSDERYANLKRITSSPDLKLTLESVKSILQNHRVPGGICQHGDLEMYTNRAYIAIPNEGKLLVSFGPPCKNEFQEFSL